MPHWLVVVDGRPVKFSNSYLLSYLGLLFSAKEMTDLDIQTGLKVWCGKY